MRRPDTAAEVMKRANESAELLGRTYGRIQSELLTPLINRTFKLMQEKGLLGMKNFDDDIIDLANAALAAERAGQTTDASTVTMPHSMFIRFVTQAQEYQQAALQYQAFHETEKNMRRFAEEDLGKFRKLIGRLFWQRGKVQ